MTPVVASTLRMRLLVVSATYTWPVGPMAMPRGALRLAAVAGDPSPANPAVPFPANALMDPRQVLVAIRAGWVETHEPTDLLALAVSHRTVVTGAGGVTVAVVVATGTLAASVWAPTAVSERQTSVDDSTPVGVSNHESSSWVAEVQRHEVAVGAARAALA